MNCFLYYIATELKVNKTDVVTVCLFRIFTFEQIILNPATVAKPLVVLTVIVYSCVVIFAKTTAHRGPGQYAKLSAHVLR